MTTAILIISIMFLIGFTFACSTADASSTPLPDPEVDAPLAKVKGEQKAVLAGGCFWGIEAVFEHVKGVSDAKSGYAGFRFQVSTVGFDMTFAGCHPLNHTQLNIS